MVGSWWGSRVDCGTDVACVGVGHGVDVLWDLCCVRGWVWTPHLGFLDLGEIDFGKILNKWGSEVANIRQNTFRTGSGALVVEDENDEVDDKTTKVE